MHFYRKQFLLLVTLLSFGMFSTARAEIDFLVAYKEKVFQQVDNTPPSAPSFWFFNAGVSGDTLVTGGTVVYPGSGGPVALTGDLGSYTTDGDDYTSQAAMDAVFPNGQYSLTIQENGAALNFGPFDLTGDAYPVTPHFLNLEELYVHDGSQSFVIEWSPFTGADPDDKIIFQIFEPELEEEIAFVVLPNDATSYVIPGGALSANFSYDMELYFVNSITGLATPQTVIGYLSSAYTNAFVGQSSANVTIPDDAVRAAVKIELDILPGDPIPFTKLETLDSLTVASTVSIDLTGLESALNLSQLTLETERLISSSPVANLENLKRIKLIAPEKGGLYFTHWSDGSQENPRIIQNTGSQSLELVANYADTPLSPFAGGFRLTKTGTVLAVTNLPVDLNVAPGDPYEIRFDYIIKEAALNASSDGLSAELNYAKANLLPTIAMEAEVRIGDYRWINRSSNDAAVAASVTSRKTAEEWVQFTLNTLDSQTKPDFPFSRGRESINISLHANLSKGGLFNGPLKVPDNGNYLNLDAVTLVGASIGSGNSSGGSNWEINLNEIIGPNRSFKFERLPSYLDQNQRLIGYPAGRPSVGQDISSENIVLNWTDPYSDSFDTYYEVWRGTIDSLAQATLIASHPSDQYYRDRATKRGVEYFYWIRAIRDGLSGGFSQSNSAVRSVTAPEDLRATQGSFSDRIKVLWKRVSGAVDYSIYRSDTNDLNSAELLAEGITGNEYDDLTPSTDSPYFYWIKSNAFNESSGFSDPTSGYIVANGITTVKASDGLFTDRVRIGWDALPGATSYDVYRNSINDSQSATLIAASILTTEYDDLLGTENQAITYFYWVRPHVGSQIGSLSNVDSGYIPSQSTSKVLAWGDNDFNQTNIPDLQLLDIVQIAAGAKHSLALGSDGKVVGWGRNEFGQSTPPLGLTDVIDIAVGYDHSLALKRDGTVEAWGRNTYGKASVPNGLENVIDIEAGAEHSLALLADGSIVGWGGNDVGQIDIPKSLTQVVQIAAGGFHNIARNADGSVVAWGDNSYGQLDIPDYITRVIDIAAGWNHNLVILPNGTVDGWGDNSRGQLDFPSDVLSSPQIKSVVILAPVTARIVDISGGLFHSLALSSKGELAAWGGDSSSQTENPEALGSVSQIAAGNEFNLIVSESLEPNIESIIPSSSDLLSGENVLLRVRATGGPDITYQWFFNDLALDQATGDALFLSNISLAQEGSYFVKVKSNGIEVSSAPVQIEVSENVATLTSQTVRAIRTSSGMYLFAPIQTNPPGLKLNIRSADMESLPTKSGSHMVTIDVDQKGYSAVPIQNIVLELDALNNESLLLMESDSGYLVRYFAPIGFSSVLQTSINMRDWVTLAKVTDGDGLTHDFNIPFPTDSFYRVVFEVPLSN